MKITIKKEEFENSHYSDCHGCALWQAVMRTFNFKPETRISVGGWEISQNYSSREILFNLNQFNADKVISGYKGEKKNVTVSIMPTKFFKKNYGLPKTNT